MNYETVSNRSEAVFYFVDNEIGSIGEVLTNEEGEITAFITDFRVNSQYTDFDPDFLKKLGIVKIVFRPLSILHLK